MRYEASEKLEIIRTVETSHLAVRRTLDKIGIPKTTDTVGCIGSRPNHEQFGLRRRAAGRANRDPSI